MNNEWEYIGLLIDQFNISVRHIEPFSLSEYPGAWVATMKKERINKPSFTVSGWGLTASEAVLRCYNSSHTAKPENVYENMEVYMTLDSGSRPYTLRHYCPNTKQHGKVFDSYCSSDDAMSAIKLYDMVYIS